MTLKVDLEFTANDAHKAVERRDLVVVIDVLRSGTTITNLLTNGAKSVVPTSTLKEAYQLRRQNPKYILLGERKGRRPRGFDFGNSPLGFTKEQVDGKNVVITTTSGTQALVRCRQAEFVLVGSFLNAEPVAARAWEIARTHRLNISFVLAGAKGRFSLEDFLCAGAIAQRLPSNHSSDKVVAAVLALRCAEDNLCKTIAETQHAKHLIELGFARDIEFSCRTNITQIVPIYRDGRLQSLR